MRIRPFTAASPAVLDTSGDGSAGPRQCLVRFSLILRLLSSLPPCQLLVSSPSLLVFPSPQTQVFERSGGDEMRPPRSSSST